MLPMVCTSSAKASGTSGDNTYISAKLYYPWLKVKVNGLTKKL
jgi:hypothetical protein